MIEKPFHIGSKLKPELIAHARSQKMQSKIIQKYLKRYNRYFIIVEIQCFFFPICLAIKFINKINSNAGIIIRTYILIKGIGLNIIP
jgi:hypothetical protein